MFFLQRIWYFSCIIVLFYLPSITSVSTSVIDHFWFSLYWLFFPFLVLVIFLVANIIVYIFIMWNIILKIKLTPKIHSNLYKCFDHGISCEPVFLKSSLILVVTFMGVLPPCLCTTFVQCPQRPREGVGSSATEVTASCKQPCRFWKSNRVPIWKSN